MQQLSKKQQKALDQAKEYFDYARKHPSLEAYREKVQEDFGFYDGTGQWSQHVLNQLAARGQSPITVNKIKNLVNYMSGMEIQTRFRTGFRSHSGKDKDDLLAKALTHLGYAIQENQDMPYKASLQFRDALITGLGWGNIYRDPQNGEIKWDYVDPLSVFYDPDDLSPAMDEMSFVARTRWFTIFQAKQLWPKHAKYFDEVFETSPNARSVSGELAQRQGDDFELYRSGDGNVGSRILVVEVQHKEMQQSFSGVDHQGHHFQTFNVEEAEALNDFETHGEITELPATQIIRTLYTGERLLEYAPLEPRLPNLKDFTYIPCLWTRRHSDGVPDGWISVMKDLQRESNYRRTKLVNNLNSFRAVVDVEALGAGKTVDKVREEIKRPDSVIMKSGKGDIKVESNQSLAKGQFDMLMRGDQELQQVSGIFDEALGKETNASSGIAIKHRQLNSVRNQVFSFDNVRLSKKRVARMMLDLIQGGGDEFLESHILTDNEKETILLNVVKEVGGKRVVLNDIRTLPLSIYVEEVPDFESFSQEQTAALEALLNNPNATLILQSPALMKRLGIRDYQELSSEMQEIMMQQQPQTPQQEFPPEMPQEMPSE